MLPEVGVARGRCASAGGTNHEGKMMAYFRVGPDVLVRRSLEPTPSAAQMPREAFSASVGPVTSAPLCEPADGHFHGLDHFKLHTTMCLHRFSCCSCSSTNALPTFFVC